LLEWDGYVGESTLGGSRRQPRGLATGRLCKGMATAPPSLGCGNCDCCFHFDFHRLLWCRMNCSQFFRVGLAAI